MQKIWHGSYHWFIGACKNTEVGAEKFPFKEAWFVPYKFTNLSILLIVSVIVANMLVFNIGVRI